MFFVIATFMGLFAIMILAKSVLIPIAFAFLIAFILFPVAKKLESWGANTMVSASLSIFALILLIAGSIFLFSNQIIDLSENLTAFKDKILQVFTDVTIFINKNAGFLPEMKQGELLNKLNKRVSESAGGLISQTVSGTSSVLFGILTAIIFTFLILIYRNGLVRAFVSFYPEENRKRATKMFKSLQQVGQQYLFGMLIIVLILGFINSIGLWIIGIDNPFLFGFLAALLAIIPYAGTFIGAAIPVLYAFINYDSLWMPLGIVLFFWFVQFVEGNFLTPKIVGGNLKINALASILSIIIGASVWGIAGMILFLPFAAMFKVVCEEYVELKPIALLISERNYQDKKDKKSAIGEWFKKMKRKLT
ncbi:MAG: AI-2E family transporter [Flavobacteriales bacterium]|nr:AI-2E family transporter [Flavobacteriales bacterium]